MVGHGGLTGKERADADQIRRQHRDGHGGSAGAAEAHALLGWDDLLNRARRLETIPVKRQRRAAEDQGANGGAKAS